MAPCDSVSGCHGMGQQMHRYQEWAENVKSSLEIMADFQKCYKIQTVKDKSATPKQRSPYHLGVVIRFLSTFKTILKRIVPFQALSGSIFSCAQQRLTEKTLSNTPVTSMPQGGNWFQTTFSILIDMTIISHLCQISPFTFLHKLSAQFYSIWSMHIIGDDCLTDDFPVLR